MVSGLKQTQKKNGVLIGVQLEEDKMQNWWWNQMPDKVVTTPDLGKIEFINSEGVEKGSLELLESDGGSAGKDEVKAEGLQVNGGTYTSA